ncbi:Cytochrome P450 2K6 [Labeo rohita]|uniref:Cytochrome P450 2K6 n=1 Tax=Labeo rohita TaxID=84645 RepID=A0ABQ8L405_LABRO|nr:Cytochrome P450 2K6 [Labeo rohita]
MSLTEALLSQGSSTGTIFGALLVCLVIYLFTISSSSQDKGEKYPPGPKPLPLLGNLHILNLKKTYISLCELAKKYGPIYTVHFGPRKVVILSGYKIIKQALVNLSEEFGDRDITPIFNDFNQGYGIAFSNGENWKEMRRFALANLRDFGMGKKRGEEIIIEEAKHLKEEFEKNEGKPFETTLPMAMAVSNVVCAIVYSGRFEYSNTKLHHMIRRSFENMKLTGSASVQIYNMFPWTRPFVANQKRIVNNLKETLRQTAEIINGLKKTLNPQDPKGIAECFLIRQQKDEVLPFIPNEVVKVHDEIDRVIGRRQPMVEDRKNLPFIDAVVHELQRFANVAPLGSARRTTCDIHLNGYFIKKGTSVWPLLVSILRDENEWETPDSFNPGHFLNKQGQFVKKDAFLPFSAGRRSCPGESLAKMEIFLFFTTLLQYFCFTPPPGVSKDDLDLTPVVGFTLNPVPHKLCAVKRFQN